MVFYLGWFDCFDCDTFQESGELLLLAGANTECVDDEVSLFTLHLHVVKLKKLSSIFNW